MYNISRIQIRRLLSPAEPAARAGRGGVSAGAGRRRAAVLPVLVRAAHARRLLRALRDAAALRRLPAALRE